jgi:hypothetical protein
VPAAYSASAKTKAKTSEKTGVETEVEALEVGDDIFGAYIYI